MKLQQIDVVGLQAAYRLFNLLRRSFFGAPVDLCHQEGFRPIPVPQRLTHTNFTLSAVVIPAVVQKVDAIVECGTNNSDALLFIRLHPDVIPPKADDRDLLAGTPQGAIWNIALGVCCPSSALAHTENQSSC